MDRITFFESISAGVDCPELILQFFDHCLALRELVQDYGSISIESNAQGSISFYITFNNKTSKSKAIENIPDSPIMIYGRPIYVAIQDISDTVIQIILQ